jgi:hypothetical protein
VADFRIPPRLPTGPLPAPGAGARPEQARAAQAAFFQAARGLPAPAPTAEPPKPAAAAPAPPDRPLRPGSLLDIKV